jgi:hypothetical protein
MIPVIVCERIRSNGSLPRKKLSEIDFQIAMMPLSWTCTVIVMQRDLSLHYNYGAADVEQWGKNISALTNRPDIPPLSVPVPPPMGQGQE